MKTLARNDLDRSLREGIKPLYLLLGPESFLRGEAADLIANTVLSETLLRDRLAGNIALAGEQELLNSAYSQNISVTVPANTRFYVVLQKTVVEATASPPAGVAGPAAQARRARSHCRDAPAARGRPGQHPPG